MDRAALAAADERLRRAAVLGVFTLRMASDAGLTRGVIRGRLRRGSWRHLVGGAYVAGAGGSRGAADEVRLRAAGAALTWPDAILAYRTAGLLHGMPLHDDGTVHVVLPVRRQASRGVVPHYFDLHRRDVRRMLSFRLTSRRRTALDCLALLPYPEAERLMAWVRTREVITAADLVTAVRERRGTPGVRQLRRLEAATRSGALSEAERRLHRILHDAGITGWEADQRIVEGGSLLARADVLFRAARLIVEADGRRAHNDFEADRERLNSLMLAGYTVLRFTWRQLVERPWLVREQIETALRRAGR
ncbi:endonuclease domain-containing protein [Georgenia daeguensis]